jgi:signal transduction histidine kinase
MSLRARLLLSIVVVNLAVTATLSLYLLSDLERRSKEQRAADDDRDQQLVDLFEQRFVDALRVEPATDEQEATVASAVRTLLDLELRSAVKDGEILQGDLTKLVGSLSADQALPANALCLNVPSGKHRAPTYDERRAKERIHDAIVKRRVVRETDPQLRGWVAAPIWLAARGGGDRATRDADVWGGGYFLLDLPPQRESTPTFQPSTLLLGMGAGTLALLALTWLLLERSVLEPLAKLSSGAERVARHEYGERVPGSGADEVGRVVASFNEMMEQVRDGEARLVQKVDEATRQAEERGRGLVIAQRLAATGTLASGIAHEINNPLGGMLNAALKLEQEAQRDPAAAARARYLRLLVDGLSRIQVVVQRVLHFTPRRVDPTVVPVLELVRNAAAFAEHRAKKAHVAIRIEGDDAPVLAEPGEMQQVFLNLLLNACDALAERGGHVTVNARRDGGRVVVAVADDGPGMSDEQRERCFDLFFTTKEPGQGTGLGLSVAHHIVEQHGGSIAVESKLGAGATFTVTLPLAGQ